MSKRRAEKTASNHGSQHVEEVIDTFKEVAVARKQPPLEPVRNVRIRSYVILSFWLVVILLGLPIWWMTTTIYRASLPLADMMEWADGRACRPVFPLQIVVDADSLSIQETEHLIRTTQHALDDLNEFSAHHLRLQQAKGLSAAQNKSTTRLIDDEENFVLDRLDKGSPDTVLTVKLAQDRGSGTPTARLESYAPILEIFYSADQLPSKTSSTSPLASFIAGELQALFMEEQAMIAYVLSDSAPGTTPGGGQQVAVGQTPQSPSGTASNGREARLSVIKGLRPDLAANLERRTTRAVKYAPTYHLTVSLFTPEASPSSWEIEEAAREFLEPLLQSLSPICNFTVDTQVQLYASFSPSVREPEFVEELGAWTLWKDDLSGFINSAEWPLSPSIGHAPTVNFILYVPSPSQTPLVVRENGGSSWLVPQWGGITILNPSKNNAQQGSLGHLSKDDLEPAILTFSHQLTLLLGLPESPPSLPLRLSTLTRVRAASLLISASSTLGSLARLTEALPSISIPETVAKSVDRTISHLQKSCTSLREGRFQDALESARIAEAEAERGFFEKSMVGQVYFPDEHKVAVYLPLLGPIGVPLVMAALKELKQFWRGLHIRRAGI
ncbi:MAG: GPI transamidase component [Vezdaea aestivalis]|nr:MAG: GPI transamidase component [Vezdaea aestivalis]